MNIPELDDIRTYQRYDGESMLDRIHDMPQLCRQAWQMAQNFHFPSDYRQINKIVILGMGGSAIGGDLLSSLVATESRVPILVHRNYELPPYVDNETLLIASSYSGSTEETVATFSQALQTSAKKMVFTTGGQLKALAQSHDVPTFIFGYKSQPRAALPFSLIPLLVILQKLELISDKSGELMAMLTALEKLAGELKETSPLAQNPAKQLAQKLTGRLPVIYGAGLFAEVAHRWKTQINENSKAWSFYEVLPELNHNAVVGFPLPAELAQYITVVLLRPNTLYPRIALRYDITTELLKQANISFEIVNGEPGSPLSQMMTGVLFGDYVSYYLALLNHVEPAPVQVISYLKDRLKVQS